MDADLAAIARQFEEQEATLTALQERASAHGDVALRVEDDVEAQFEIIGKALAHRAAPRQFKTPIYIRA